MKKIILIVSATLLASSALPDAVEQHLEQFNREWAEPLPPNSEFGIQRVLSYLDLNFQGLENVKAAAEAKDDAAAERALLAYFRETRIPDPGWDAERKAGSSCGRCTGASFSAAIAMRIRPFSAAQISIGPPRRLWRAQKSTMRSGIISFTG